MRRETLTSELALLEMKMKSIISVLSVVGVVAAQSLLQPLPSQYANRSDIVYISNNLAVIPPPFNYTGGLYLNSFTTLNVSNSSFASQLNTSANASFFIFDPRFIDILGPNPQLELFFNLSTNVHEAPSFIPEQNVVFFSELETANQFFIQLNNTPPTITNVTFTPPIFSINGGTYSPRDGLLYLAANGGNGTVPAVWQADPKNLTSKVLVNNYRGLHLNSPDDCVVSNQTGLVYFTDPFYAYILGTYPEPPQNTQNVYSFNVTSGALQVLDDTLVVPNGIAFSPDESILYVSDTSSLNAAMGLPLNNQGHHTIYAYDITPSGGLQNRRTVYQTDQWIPDGIKVVKSGNIYTAAGNFIDVVDPNGVLLGKIRTPTFTTNLVFAGSGGLWLVGQGAAYRVLISELE